MNIDILCVGKIKEKYLRDAVDEYSKRLSRYCKINIVEVNDEKTPDEGIDSLEEKVRETEGERLARYLKDNAFIVTLEIEGSQLSSPELAKKIGDIAVSGRSHIQFIIGGSLGLSKDIIKRADMHLSFSQMTFPHQLMRVILLEQIYRAFKINANEPYHK